MHGAGGTAAHYRTRIRICFSPNLVEHGHGGLDGHQRRRTWPQRKLFSQLCRDENEHEWADGRFRFPHTVEDDASSAGEVLVLRDGGIRFGISRGPAVNS